MVSLFNRAIEVVKTNKKASQQYLFGIVMHMVGLILSESQNKKSGVKFTHQIIERAKIIMNENIFKDIYPEELAFKLDVNYTTFRKLFKKNTGFAPAKYFHALKIRKAKQLLLESSSSVKEIANMLNFYSPESFDASFKKNTGLTPSKYRFDCRQTV